MNRRNFLKQTLLTGGGIGTGLILVPYLIENAVIYAPEELKKKELLSVDISSLEMVVMTSNLLREEDVKNITNLYDKTIKKLDINSKTEKIRERIVELVIDNSRKFSRKKPSKEKLRNLGDEIDSLSYEISKLKNEEKINFIGVKRDTFVDIGNDISKFGNSNFEEFYKINNHAILTEKMVQNEKNDEGKLILGSTYNTLKKIAPDALFFLEASNISKIPIEEIVAWANVESEGREFAVGREGEINRFQLNPLYINDIYKNALLKNNALSEYIRKNMSQKSLLEDAVRDSKLSIALAVNHMLHLKKETNKYYEYVLAYNRGISGVFNLSPKTKKNWRILKR